MLRGRGWSCCEQPPDAHPASSQSDSLFAGCSGDTVILKKHVEDGRWLEGEQWAVHHCARRCLKEPSTDHRPQRGGEGRDGARGAGQGCYWMVIGWSVKKDLYCWTLRVLRSKNFTCLIMYSVTEYFQKRQLLYEYSTKGFGAFCTWNRPPEDHTHTHNALVSMVFGIERQRRGASHDTSCYVRPQPEG